MEKKSKCTGVKPDGSFASQHGTVYKYYVQFENGDAGHYNSKSENQDRIKVGEEIIYEAIANGKHPDKIKPINPEYSRDFKSEENNHQSKPASNGTVYSCNKNRSFAIAYAKDLLVANWSNPMNTDEKLKTKDMFDLADKILNWLEK